MNLFKKPRTILRILPQKESKASYGAQRGKQSGFALPIAILIVAVLIIAGGAGYYFYITSQEQKEQVVDETADWNIYNNYTFGYKIKYPDNFFTTIPSPLSGNKNTSFKIVSQVGVTIQIGQNLERLSAIDWIKQAPDDISFFIRKSKDTMETIDINEKECVRVFSVTQSQGLPIDQWVHTVIPFETRMVVISKVEKDKSYNIERIYQKMLPTFEFVEVETANWKVYTNEKYGFEMKFPESWADFEIHEWKADQDLGRMPPYFDTIEFKIDRTQDNGKEYYFAIRIYAYSHDNWAARRLGQQTKEYSFISASHLSYPYLGENKDYVFSWDTSRGILSPETLQEDLAEDILQLRNQEAESIISTFKIINPLEKTAEWKNYFNPGECKDIGENDYTNECYLESLKVFAEVELCKKIRPDYRDFCYFQVAQTLKQPSICQNLSVLINQESCYYNIAVSLKDASICQNIQTETRRDFYCYGVVAEKLKDPSICEKIENQKVKGYCLMGANPKQPELPIPLVSEWKTYINEKHKYSFKHPPKWDFSVELTNPETSELHVVREKISNQTRTAEWLWFVTIVVWDNPQKLSLKEWLSARRFPLNEAPLMANTSVGKEKVEALRVWQDGTSTWDKPGKCFQTCPSLAVYFVYKDKAYLAGLEYRDEVDDVGQESQETFNQILSTFKFIK